MIQYEKKCDELIKEKEVLATEVWKLKKQLSESAGGFSDVPHGSNEVTETRQEASDSQSGLDNYDPNNQHALRRKISEYYQAYFLFSWIALPTTL